jgi:hypothetical protein
VAAAYQLRPSIFTDEELALIAAKPPPMMPNGLCVCFANVALHIFYSIVPLRHAVFEGRAASAAVNVFFDMAGGGRSGTASKPALQRVFGTRLINGQQSAWEDAFRAFVERLSPGCRPQDLFEQFCVFNDRNSGMVELDITTGGVGDTDLFQLIRSVPEFVVVPRIVVFSVQRNRLAVVAAPQGVVGDAGRRDWVKCHNRVAFPMHGDIAGPLLHADGDSGRVHVLAAVVVHVGANAWQGHYAVHILKAGQWWYCNDRSVTIHTPVAAEGPWIPAGVAGVEQRVVGLVYVEVTDGDADLRLWDF